jgi:hypothetical protein
MTTINITNTTLVVTIERILDENNEPTNQMICLIKDTSIPAPEFNPITFLDDVCYNVVHREYFTI